MIRAKSWMTRKANIDDDYDDDDDNVDDNDDDDASSFSFLFSLLYFNYSLALHTVPSYHITFLLDPFHASLSDFVSCYLESKQRKVLFPRYKLLAAPCGAVEGTLARGKGISAF